MDWNQPSKSNEDEKDAIEGEDFDVEISVYYKPKYANEIIVISVDQYFEEVVIKVGLDKENYRGYASYMMKENSRINGVEVDVFG